MLFNVGRRSIHVDFEAELIEAAIVEIVAEFRAISQIVREIEFADVRGIEGGDIRPNGECSIVFGMTKRGEAKHHDS